MLQLNKTSIVNNASVEAPEYADGKEYVVCLNEGVDYDQFWNEIENNSTGIANIPDRAVRIKDERLPSLRSCNYILTDEEAANLRNDTRVFSVEVPPLHRPNLIIRKQLTDFKDFTKPSSDTTTSTGNVVNWGLKRIISATNNYGTGTTVSGGYDYVLDGSGIDVVIMDTGIQADHPEFQDATGSSRLQQINWYTASGVSGTQSGTFYTDNDGHGTVCASIAAGKTYGWAKNSRVYSIKINELVTSGDGIPVLTCFDVLLGWHNNKPIDSTTGVKRPTVVNMSWGFLTNYFNPSGGASYITGGNYRGTPWTGTTVQTAYGMGPNGITTCPARDSSVDVALEELITAGIHCFIASGNNYMKVDSLVYGGSEDYNNYWTDTFSGTNYYNRGSSPYSTNAHIVGSISATSFSASVDQKVSFSNGGPGVDYYAPGHRIQCGVSNTNTLVSEGYQDQPYFLNSSYKQTNISGTSMAAPQAVGASALILQIWPGITPARLKQTVINYSQSTLRSTGLNNDYSTYGSLWGGPNRNMYIPFGSPISASTSGASRVSGNATLTFK